ncbi:MAG TPA: polysaccharide ABC transporter ATP-binding protein [Kiritimatiellia bacterium]|mgnify:CR=1 FL=1|nr:polysaccharide ABC transporter ATP-binding protein [Kiritimatiellia bacterium]HMP34416.1 polysaccharide ABC transporter ATP-binding protein [Kiritimatiellia bacterium]
MPPAIIVNDVSKKFARSLKRGMIYGLSDMARMALVPRRWQSEGAEARMRDAGNEMRETSCGMRDASSASTESESDSAVPGSLIANPGSRIPTPASRIADPESRISHPVTEAQLRPTEFWALRNVSFTLQPGESVGLLGANGAGKSTLFSVLSGIYAPTYGKVSYRGRLQALIALGAGFHPSLSGRENLYINAAILGLKEKEVSAIYENIVDFSGIGSFIDAPIKNYSSGMIVRLAFSIAVHLDPDILLIDEVLAVGDAAFQLKCAKYARELVNSGKTIVVVSHNMLIIQMMCRRSIWMDHGTILQDGDTHQVTRDYQQFMLMKSAEEKTKSIDSGVRFAAMILQVEWLDAEGRPCPKLTWGKPHQLAIEFEAHEAIEQARFWVEVSAVGKEGLVMGVSMYDDGHYLDIKPGRHRLLVHWDHLPLAQENLYQVCVGVRDWSGQIMLADSFASRLFEVNHHGPLCAGEPAGQTSRLLTPLVAAPYRWTANDGMQLHAFHKPST